MMNVNDWGPQSKVYYVTFEFKMFNLGSIYETHHMFEKCTKNKKQGIL
jgi:hypothetical protein